MGKDKTRTGGIGRIDPDAATEDHGYLAADGKAEARAFLLVAVEFLETVEDHLLFVERNAGARIGYRKEHFAVCLVYLHAECDTPLGSELTGVGEQVDQNLRQAVDIGYKHVGTHGTFETPLDTFLPRMGGRHEHMLADLHDLLGRAVELDLAAFERRNVEDVVQQREQHLGIVDHDGAVLGTFLL